MPRIKSSTRPDTGVDDFLEFFRFESTTDVAEDMVSKSLASLLFLMRLGERRLLVAEASDPAVPVAKRAVLEKAASAAFFISSL